MSRKILMLAIALAIAPGLTNAASVYKWTDENGVTHFGDRQPTGQTAERVNIRTGTPSKSASERPSPQERLNSLEEQQQEQAEREQETAVQEARRKQREANCATARSNLKLLSQTGRIRIEENGEQRFLTPEEIQQKREEFEQIAADNCGPAESDAI